MSKSEALEEPMYAYQGSDGWYRLALYTSRRELFSELLKRRDVLSAYDAPYNSQRAAEQARTWIAEQIGIAL
jgi:hypothetical protein